MARSCPMAVFFYPLFPLYSFPMHALIPAIPVQLRPCSKPYWPSVDACIPVYRSRTATPLNSGARDLGHEQGGASAAGRLTKPLTPLGYGDLYYALCNKNFHVASTPFCWLRRDSKRSNERRSQCFSSTALSLFTVKRSPSFSIFHSAPPCSVP